MTWILVVCATISQTIRHQPTAVVSQDLTSVIEDSQQSGGGDNDCLYYETNGNDCVFCEFDYYVKSNGDCANISGDS